MRIGILDDYLGLARSLADWESIPDVEEVAVFDEPLSGHVDTVRLLERFDVLSIMRERTAFPAELLRELPRLRLLASTGMKNSAIDLEAASAAGIVVTGTSGVPNDTPELTWGLLLALARDIPAQERDLREGRWQTRAGIGVDGKRLGLLGLGRIGGRVAAYAHAFGMEVVAWSQNLTQERADEVGVERVSKEELLRTSDIMSIHLRLSQRTQGLIGVTELASMRSGALLINTSRGPIVDEAALVEALSDGQLGGAALDVYDVEPLPTDHPLLRAPNALLTPHLGYATRENLARFYSESVEAIRAFAAGAPIRVLNPQTLR